MTLTSSSIPAADLAAEILALASHDVIKELQDIRMRGNPQQRVAADLMALAALALRDTVNRADAHGVYRQRLMRMVALIAEQESASEHEG
jgi:hypothetical protein